MRCIPMQQPLTIISGLGTAIFDADYDVLPLAVISMNFGHDACDMDRQ